MNKKISNTIGRKPKLITKKLEKRFNEIGYQEENKNPIVVVRFFSTSGDIWYATEYFHDVKDFYGYASLGDNFKEWGYFYLKELEDYENQGFYVERDLHFKEGPLNECLKADGLL
ncbi:DUF2958 domain-containing protein [Candidatus Uabimicrobium sp. HlEnr_7]|uniref:DUF2958 domain-containing protein n=1 Tax=Candidatus Uabimicrobium helgolandensis TaxID=3095367 RepID=UPI0035567B7E